MASVTGRYTAPSTNMASNSTQTQPAIWSYAVPSDEDPQTSSYSDPSATPYAATLASRTPTSNQTSNTSRPAARRRDKPLKPLDNNSAYASDPPMHNDLNDEDDNLADLHESRNPIKRKGSQSMVSTLSNSHQNSEKESKWIHRDKLAQIESRELAELGLSGRVSKPRSRGNSKKASSVTPSLDLNGDTQEWQDSQAPDYKRMRTTSPPLNYEDENQDTELGSAPALSNHSRKISSSRIPITRNSPSTNPGSPTQAPPSPHERLIRARSENKQNVSGIPKASSPTDSSPTAPDSAGKRKQPTKIATPPATIRQNSKGTTKPTPSATPTAPRPGTAGGSRPSTARPEGEAPWIATMFKPDPRLPQEQQMLPTHAKRLAEEQHMREVMQYREYQDQQNNEYSLEDEEDDDDEHSPDIQDPEKEEYQRQAIIHRDHGSTQGLGPPSPAKPERMPPSPGFVGFDPAKGLDKELNPDPTAHQGQYLSYQPNSPNDTRHSPQLNSSHREDGQWPLRTGSGHEMVHPALRPASETSPVSQAPPVRTGTPVLDSSYSLIPAIQSNGVRDSQRSGLSNTASAVHTNSSTQVTRLPDNPDIDEKGKKKGGCASCCLVM